jgi:hypothetical protein
MAWREMASRPTVCGTQWKAAHGAVRNKLAPGMEATSHWAEDDCNMREVVTYPAV